MNLQCAMDKAGVVVNIPASNRIVVESEPELAWAQCVGKDASSADEIVIRSVGPRKIASAILPAIVSLVVEIGVGTDEGDEAGPGCRCEESAVCVNLTIEAVEQSFAHDLAPVGAGD